MHFSACDTRARYCARPVFCWFAFPSASALGSPAPQRIDPPCSSASQLLWRSLTPRLRASSATAPRLPHAGQTGNAPVARRGVSRFPRKERPHMPVSTPTPGRLAARDIAPIRIAFRQRNDVGARERVLSRLNGWPVRSRVNASLMPSRAAAHDSGSMRSLLLHRDGLASSTPCRSPGALRFRRIGEQPMDPNGACLPRWRQEGLIAPADFKASACRLFSRALLRPAELAAASLLYARRSG
jgi:hypothetical protein